MAHRRPDYAFLSKLAKKYFLDVIPKGYRFFGRDTLETPFELNKLICAYSDLIGYFWYKVKSVKRATLLLEAWDQFLDLWALEANINRLSGEDDEALRERVIEAILAPKPTLQGLGIHSQRVVGPDGFTLSEPWRNLAYLNKSNFQSFTSLPEGRLGSMRLSDQNWYRRNTFFVNVSSEVNTNSLNRLVERINEVKAVGVRAVIFHASDFLFEEDPTEFEVDCISNNVGEIILLPLVKIRPLEEANIITEDGEQVITEDDLDDVVLEVSATPIDQLEPCSQVCVEVCLTEPFTEPLYVKYDTENDTCLAGIDYIPKTEVLEFLPGEISKIVCIDLLCLPCVTVLPSVQDVDKAAITVDVTFVLSAPYTDGPIFVVFDTEDWTAKATVDFIPPSITDTVIQFLPGEVERVVTINLLPGNEIDATCILTTEDNLDNIVNEQNQLLEGEDC